MIAPRLQALLSLSVLILSCRHVAAVYGINGPVVILDDDGFKKNVSEGTEPWLVDFYQDNCGPCKEFAPEYSKTAEKLKGLVKVGVVDCGKSPETCSVAGLKTLPAVKFYSWERLKNPYNGKWYKDSPVDYVGEMRAKKIIEFATGQLPGSFVHNISSDTSEETFFADSNIAKVVLFSAKVEVTPLYKAISLHLRGRLLFAQAKSKDEKLCEQFGATQFPSIYVQTISGERQKYDGPLRADAILEFLEPFAIEAPLVEEKGKKQREGREGEASPEEERRVWVKKIAGTQFEAKILTAEDVWLVAFLESTEIEGCSEKRKEWEAASGNLTGMVHVAELEIDGDEEAKRLSTKYGFDFSIEGPHECVGVLLFPFGDDKGEQGPEEFKGPMVGKELLSFSLQAIPATFVRSLTSDLVDSFVEMFPQKPKVILFSNKVEVSPLYRTLSTNFRQFISFALVHSSETTVVERFRVTKFPDIILMFSQPSRVDPSKLEMSVNHYQGPLKYAQLSAIFTQMASFAVGLEGDPDTSVDIPELVDDDGFGKSCISVGKLCVIALLKGPSKALDDLRKVASVWVNGGQFSFSWIDIEKHSGFPIILGVPPGSLPTVVVISPARKRIVFLGKEFTPQGLQALLEGIFAKRVGTDHLEVLPSFSAAKKAEPIQEDAPMEEEPVVEEFNLDDILGQEVEGGEELGTKGQRLEEVERELEAEEAKRREDEEAAKAAAKSTNKKKKKKKKTKKSGTKDEL